MLQEIERTARRLDRSLSWIVQTAWKSARKEIMATPAARVAGVPAETSEEP
jgi:uncharacterized small protein (TIGR04563 family)